MFIAHCPESNTNLSSGVVTIRQYLKEGMYVGLGGGGEFFGKVGTFEKGYEFDAVVLDDSSLRHPQELIVKERLERMIYLADDRNVVAKFVNGKSVPRDKDGDETAIFGGNQ